MLNSSQDPNSSQRLRWNLHLSITFERGANITFKRTRLGFQLNQINTNLGRQNTDILTPYSQSVIRTFNSWSHKFNHWFYHVNRFSFSNYFNFTHSAQTIYSEPFNLHKLWDSAEFWKKRQKAQYFFRNFHFFVIFSQIIKIHLHMLT